MRGTRPRRLAGLIFLRYITKVREAIADRDGIADRPLLCKCEGEINGMCCENYWCITCLACFLMRHDINVQSQGMLYTELCLPAGTPVDVVHPRIMNV